MISFLKGNTPFPDPESANDDGLLAIGGDLTVERLIKAYSSGIFPWFNEGSPILWWCPNPRCVLFIDEIKISSRLKRRMRNSGITVTFNTAFAEVIKYCSVVHKTKKDSKGTWITKSMIDAYINLFNHGYCLSAESWYKGKLVGGLYGVYINNVFSGESMFTLMKDASKIALIKMAEYLSAKGCKIIDCQIPSEHMIRFGARLIPRKEFLGFLNNSHCIAL